jgi:hypothetical protein
MSRGDGHERLGLVVIGLEEGFFMFLAAFSGGEEVGLGAGGSAIELVVGGTLGLDVEAVWAELSWVGRFGVNLMWSLVFEGGHRW